MVFSENKPTSVGEPEGRRDRAISEKMDELLAQLEEIDYQLFSISQSPGLKDDDYSPAAQTAYRFMTARAQSEEKQQLISERERLHQELTVLKAEQKISTRMNIRLINIYCEIILDCRTERRHGTQSDRFFIFGSAEKLPFFISDPSSFISAEAARIKRANVTQAARISTIMPTNGQDEIVDIAYSSSSKTRTRARSNEQTHRVRQPHNLNTHLPHKTVRQHELLIIIFISQYRPRWKQSAPLDTTLAGRRRFPLLGLDEDDGFVVPSVFTFPRDGEGSVPVDRSDRPEQFVDRRELHRIAACN